MARRAPRKDPGIILARLDGTARRLLHEKVDRDTCIAELHAITTDPQLLGQAAGTALGAWRHSPVSGYDGDRVARMMEAAGADLAVRDERAAEVERRLSVRASGIGNP